MYPAHSPVTLLLSIIIEGMFFTLFILILYMYQLTVYSDIFAALSLSSSIVWDDCEGILIARTYGLKTQNVSVILIQLGYGTDTAVSVGIKREQSELAAQQKVNYMRYSIQQ